MTMVHIAIDLQDESEVARVLSLLNQEHIPHRVERRNVISDEERAAVSERIRRGGSQTLDGDVMIATDKNSQPYKTSVLPKALTAEQKSTARESVIRDSSSMDIDAMLEHLRESRQDRKMPFREDE